MDSSDRDRALVFAFAFVVIAAALRFFTLSSADIVNDEYFTALYYEERAQWLNNSLIYRLVLLSLAAFGESEFALRLPSLIFGVGSIFLTYLLGAQLFSRAVGVLAAAILTFLPWHIWHSQYARYYAVVLFFVILMYVFVVRAVRRDSISGLCMAAVAAVLAVASHVTAVLIPFSCWLVCVVLYFFPSLREDFVSRRIVHIGFWTGVVSIAVVSPFVIDIFIGWSSSAHGWVKYPAQLVFQYYREIGAVGLVALLALLVAIREKRHFAATYLIITMLTPLCLVMIGSLIANMRADYAIGILAPMVIAAAFAINSVWRQSADGRVVATVLTILLVIDATPRLISHYTDRLSRYSSNAVEFLLENYRPGDRIAVFVPGVRYYLSDDIEGIERDGLGNPGLRSRPWPPVELAPTTGRLWVAFRVTRDDLAPDVRRWLRSNNARFIWRDVSFRVDSQVRGVEIFLLCSPSIDKCDNKDPGDWSSGSAG